LISLACGASAIPSAAGIIAAFAISEAKGHEPTFYTAKKQRVFWSSVQDRGHGKAQFCGVISFQPVLSAMRLALGGSLDTLGVS
jgi:hypothetical protein